MSAPLLLVNIETHSHLSSVHETYASLYSRRGDLTKAQEHVMLADQQLKREGSFATTSWISGLCAYRSACVALLQGCIPQAIEEAEKSVALSKICSVPIGVRARSYHILSKALLRDPERQTEGEEARKEAQRLRSLLPNSRTDLSDESDSAFEKLVVIDHR